MLGRILRAPFVLALALLAFLFPMAGPALAAPPAAVHAIVDARALAAPPVALVVVDRGVTAATPIVTFSVDPAAVVQLVLAVFLPILVALVTTRVTSASRKAWLLASLTLVTSLLVELGRSIDAGVPFDIGRTVIAAIPAFAISVATHYGLWKPTGTSVALQDVGARHRA